MLISAPSAKSEKRSSKSLRSKGHGQCLAYRPPWIINLYSPEDKGNAQSRETKDVTQMNLLNASDTRLYNRSHQPTSHPNHPNPTLRLCDVDWSFTHNAKRRDTATHVTHWALILVRMWRELAWLQSFPRILYVLSKHRPWSYDLNVCCCISRWALGALRSME